MFGPFHVKNRSLGGVGSVKDEGRTCGTFKLFVTYIIDLLKLWVCVGLCGGNFRFQKDDHVLYCSKATGGLSIPKAKM